VFFQHIRTLFVLPQLKQVLGEEEHVFQGWLRGLDSDRILLLGVSVAVDETFDQEAFLDV